MTQNIKHTPEQFTASYQHKNGWTPCIKSGGKVIWSCEQGFTNRTETSSVNWSALSRAQRVLALALKSDEQCASDLKEMKKTKTGGMGAEITNPKWVAQMEWAVNQAKFAREALQKAGA